MRLTAFTERAFGRYSKDMDPQKNSSTSFFSFYTNFSCSVIYNNTLTEWFNITSGVRQGFIMSPMLFLVAIDWVMRITVGNKRRGIRWTLTSMLEDIDFAEDIALLSSNANHLQKKTNDLKDVVK